jgi:probable addiction module antidote protein
MTSKRFETKLNEDLRQTEFAAAYLAAAMEDDEENGGIDGLLHAVREIAIAHDGGIRNTAKKAKVGRQTIYDGFKHGGNPQIRTVDAILRTIGLRLSVQEAPRVVR